MNRCFNAAARTCVLALLLSFQQVNASAASVEQTTDSSVEHWYFVGCVPKPSECKYSCPTKSFGYVLGGEDCDPKDYQARYACYCFGTLDQVFPVSR